MCQYNDLILYIILFLVFVVIASLYGYNLKLKQPQKVVYKTPDDLHTEVVDAVIQRRKEFREKAQGLREKAIFDIVFFDDEARDSKFKKLSETSYPYVKSYLMGMMYDHIYNIHGFLTLTDDDHRLIEAYGLFYTKGFILIFNNADGKPPLTDKLTFNVKVRGVYEKMNIPMQYITYLFKVDLIAHSSEYYS